MQLARFDDARDFYARAGDFLLHHEAEHNLMLGLCDRLIKSPASYEQPAYLATVEGAGRVVAAALMTPPQNLLLGRVDAPGALRPIAHDLRGRYETLPGVLGPSDASLLFAKEWQGTSGRPYRKGVAERIYQLDTVIPVVGVAGSARRATPSDRALVVAWMTAFAREALGDDDARLAGRMVDARLPGGPDAGLLLWEDGEAVAMAGYSGPTPHGIRVGPVYTPPEHRGKGYASACVAALSQQLLDGSRSYCFLFTDLANPTSNRIYQAIGYRQVCDADEYLFS